jgi:hypothetical protein
MNRRALVIHIENRSQDGPMTIVCLKSFSVRQNTYNDPKLLPPHLIEETAPPESVMRRKIFNR